MLAGAALLVSAAVVAALTLGARPGQEQLQFHVLLVRLARRTGLPVLTSDQAEGLANVLLFLPLGLLLPLIVRARLVLLVAGLSALSGAIELAQTVLAGRTPSLRDVALNTTGAAVGVVFTSLVVGGRDAARRRRSVLGAVGGVRPALGPAEQRGEGDQRDHGGQQPQRREREDVHACSFDVFTVEDDHPSG